MSLTCAFPVPVLRVIDLAVLDAPGNGYLDPGESAGLVTVLKNFGASAVGVTADLETGEPYVSVTQASGFFGDIAEGAVRHSGSSRIPMFRSLWALP